MSSQSTHRRDGALAVALVVITALAAAPRLPDLARRPMHGDEAVHAVKLWDLHTTGTYRYDPHEYHGPTLYYLTLPVIRFCGVRSFAELSEAHLRLVTVVFGFGLIPLLWLVRDGLGRAGVVVSALLTAVSPAMTFYSRYYIQETLLVFFTFLMLAAGWRYSVSRKIGWAAAAGVSAGLAHATKETCVIAFACAAAAWVCLRWGGGKRETGPGAKSRRDDAIRSKRGVRLALPVAFVCGAAVSVAFYSAFFTHARGPADSVLTYATYLDRAGNYGLHDHPWWTYLQILAYTHWGPGPAWSEGAILALFGIGPAYAFLRNGPEADAAAQARQTFGRYVVLYASMMIVVYSAIPYKTPWCMLGFLHAAILVGGFGFNRVLTAAGRPALKALAVALFVAATGHLARQASLLTGPRFESDRRNPYVYAHPVGGVLRMTSYLEALAEAHPQGRSLRIDVVSPDADYWPLPWYLRSCEGVAYWDAPPEELAPVVVANTILTEETLKRLGDGRHVSYYGFRPDVVMLVSVERSVFDQFAARQRAPAPSAP
ncbi:MAG: hypothetical protein FLDDKLPJ_03116 [Phycisphaerae bacterium]|nr:hypothetical protein [Phycisphaerae bacterium]